MSNPPKRKATFRDFLEAGGRMFRDSLEQGSDPQVAVWDAIVGLGQASADEVTAAEQLPSADDDAIDTESEDVTDGK